MFNPSEKQKNIFNCWIKENKNILISAVAGSGKTTTLIELLKISKGKVLFLAFNKIIQKDIELKLKKLNLKNGKALTIHSLCLKTIKNIFKNAEVSNNKYYKIVNKLVNTNDFILKSLLLSSNDVSRIFFTDDISKIKEYLVDYSMKIDKKNIEYLDTDIFKKYFDYLIKEREKSFEIENIEIDFLDMLYLVVKKDLEIPYDPKFIFIDEGQDLSHLQHLVIEKLIKKDSVEKYIVCGDDNQAIYLFNGALSTSLDYFRNKENVVEMPLDICYRCGPNIIKYGNEIFPVLIPYDIDFTDKVEYEEDINNIKENSLVVCRNEYPLIRLYISLKQENKNCYIKGQSEILNELSYKIKSHFNSKDKKIDKISDLIEIFNEEILKLKYYSKDNILFKNILLIKELSKLIYNNNVSNLLNLINEINNGEYQKNDIVLSTIHKAKGLENDIVYILNEHLIPSQSAKTDESLKQEENLKYIARTRAKKELYFIDAYY